MYMQELCKGCKINEDTKILVNNDIKTKQLYIIGEINSDMTKDIIKALFETDWVNEKIKNLKNFNSR